MTTFNQMTITQTSDDNTVGAVTQVSEGSVANGANTLSITQGGSGSQTVDRVRQTQQDGKAAQFTTIEQTGAFNRVALIDQLANSNAYDADNQITLRMTGVRNGQIGLSGAAAETIVTDNGIVQEAGNGDIRSNGNRVDLLITGDFNRFGIRQGGRMNDVGFITINGNENQLGLRQDGTENDIVIAAPIEGAFNIIGIDQLGTNAAILSLDTASAGDGGAQSDRNSVFIHQDGTNSVTFDLKGDDNDFRIDQDYDNVGRGGNNVAALSVFGNGNIGLVRQYGDNLATIKISGDNNLTASATAILPVASVGEFVQDGKGNEASVFVFGDTNIMGTFQSGDDHRLFMTIIGSGNQAAISQSGAANIGNLVQNGKGNAASILQR
ncbi:MAG: hypothetical protein KKB02_00095 [Alphaproteobacteria bacterium]|nr:hypothetical protein [Alphaproteobacteria bacterium]